MYGVSSQAYMKKIVKDPAEVYGPDKPACRNWYLGCAEEALGSLLPYMPLKARMNRKRQTSSYIHDCVFTIFKTTFFLESWTDCLRRSKVNEFLCTQIKCLQTYKSLAVHEVILLLSPFPPMHAFLSSSLFLKQDNCLRAALTCNILSITGSFMKMPSANGEIIYMDQTWTSGRGKFANCKCHPNALLSVTTCSGPFLFAKEIIAAGIEVTYDSVISCCDLDQSDDEDDDVPTTCHWDSGELRKGYFWHHNSNRSLIPSISLSPLVLIHHIC